MKTNYIIFGITMLLLVGLVNATSVDSRCGQYDWKLSESSLVVEGTVKDVVVSSDKTTVTMAVSKNLKGSSGNEITFSYLGGQDSVALGFPQFTIGEKTRVFLYYSESEKAYSIICAALGKEELPKVETNVDKDVKSSNLIIETKDFYKPNESIEISLTNKNNESVYVVYGDGCGLGFDIFSKYTTNQKTPVTIKDPGLACLMMYRVEEVKANETKIIGIWDQREFTYIDGTFTKTQVANGEYTIELTLTDKNLEDTYTISKKVIINQSNAEESRPVFVRFWTWLTGLFNKK